MEPVPLMEVDPSRIHYRVARRPQPANSMHYRNIIFCPYAR